MANKIIRRRNGELKDVPDVNALKQYYVYVLRDPRNDEIFYVGKGTEDRIFQHEKEVERGQVTTKKQKRIKDIKDSGANEQKIIIGRFNAETEAFAVEATLIHWMYGKNSLTNDQSGHGVHHIRPKNNYNFLPGIDEPDKDFSDREREKRDRYNIVSYLQKLQTIIEKRCNIKFDDIDTSEEKHTYLYKIVKGVKLSVVTHHNPKESAAITIQCVEKNNFHKKQIIKIAKKTRFELHDKGRYARIPPSGMHSSVENIITKFQESYKELLNYNE